MIAASAGKVRANEYIPDIGPLGWLYDLLEDAGSTGVAYTMNGSQAAALRWPEITAWIDGSCQRDIGPQWRREVMNLSAAYAFTLNMANHDLAFEVPFQPPEK